MTKRLTTNPMPGVRRIGSSYTVAVARKGGDLQCFFPPQELAAAQAWARSIAGDYDEVIIIAGTLQFRIWDATCNGRIVAETTSGIPMIAPGRTAML